MGQADSLGLMLPVCVNSATPYVASDGYLDKVNPMGLCVMDEENLWTCDWWVDNGAFYEADWLTWQQEHIIFSQEIKGETGSLSVSISPLFASATCRFCIGAGWDEIYELHIEDADGHPFLEIFLINKGIYQNVYYGLIPFGYDALVNALSDLPDAALLLQVLYHSRLRWMASMGVSLDRIILASRFLQYDYPDIYWLALARSRRIELARERVMDRAFLSRCLEVPSVTSSQMAALRRLETSRRSLELTYNAIDVVGRQWELIKSLVVHEKTLDPATVYFVGLVLESVPHAARCRWFNFCHLSDSWLWEPPFTTDELRIEEVAAIFIFEWLALEAMGISPLSINSGREMEGIILENYRKRVHSRLCSRQHIVNYIDERLSPRMKLHRESSWILINDHLFNDQSESIDCKDNEPFPVSRLIPAYGFSQVSSVGELRSLALRLQNCAASRVHMAMHADAEFWVYQDSDEVCLLQLEFDFDNSRHRLVEFLGFKNRSVSENAMAALKAWSEHNHRFGGYIII